MLEIEEEQAGEDDGQNIAEWVEYGDNDDFIELISHNGSNYQRFEHDITNHLDTNN